MHNEQLLDQATFPLIGACSFFLQRFSVLTWFTPVLVYSYLVLISNIFLCFVINAA